MYKILLLLFYPLIILASSPEESARKIQAHLLIEDVKSAAREGEIALLNHPEDPLVCEWAIRSFAASGEEGKMISAWNSLKSINPMRSLDQTLLEKMCWGILKKGKEGKGLSTQLIALIGAALTQDSEAVPFLLDGLRHPNAQLREISVELAAHYGDYPLRQELARLFREESVLDVRLCVFRAVALLQMEEFLPQLIQCVANPKTGAKEKAVAIEAIVHMRDHVSKEELQIIASSKRSGLRELACEVIAYCQLNEESSLLIPLLHDSQPEVCAAALRTWGILRKEITPEITHLALESIDPLVGITASWIWLIADPIQSEAAMTKWLEHEHPHVRALAASAVAKAGNYGIPLAKKMVERTQDPFVKANLALALAGQRESVEKVCSLLEECLQNNEKWMFSENHLFETLEKSTLSHKPAIPNYPEVVNQSVRLELLNLLAILDSPHALEAIKCFLKERKWGVTGLAAEMLLGEGDEKAIDFVRELLSDPDHEVRLEAALVLATWGKDPSAASTLLEVYPQADRQLKIKILESLGRIGDRNAIPFLIERLKEPSLILRMIAASVLLQTLNH
jgi:HEAT repeat protein